jgi:hypothetical protein
LEESGIVVLSKLLKYKWRVSAPNFNLSVKPEPYH